jgi:hypothetical protein
MRVKEFKIKYVCIKEGEASTRKWSHCVRFILPPRLPQKVSKLESIFQRGSGPQRYFRLWDQEKGGGEGETRGLQRKGREETEHFSGQIIFLCFYLKN